MCANIRCMLMCVLQIYPFITTMASRTNHKNINCTILPTQKPLTTWMNYSVQTLDNRFHWVNNSQLIYRFIFMSVMVEAYKFPNVCVPVTCLFVPTILDIAFLHTFFTMLLSPSRVFGQVLYFIYNYCNTNMLDQGLLLSSQVCGQKNKCLCFKKVTQFVFLYRVGARPERTEILELVSSFDAQPMLRQIDDCTDGKSFRGTSMGPYFGKSMY